MILSKLSLRLLLFIILITFFGCASKKSLNEVHNELIDCQSKLLINSDQKNEKIDSLVTINRKLVNEKKQIDSEMQSLEESLNSIYEEKNEIVESYNILENDMAKSLRENFHLKSSNTALNSIVNRNSQQKAIYDSIISNKNVNNINYSLNEGRVAFYCPKEMDYKISYSVFGLIADVLSNEEAKSILINKIISIDETIDASRLQNDSILVREIQYYNLVKLVLDEASNNSFEIKKIHDDDIQEVKANMEGWHWEVKPIDTEPDQKLILKVLYYDENNDENYEFSKSYEINVKVNANRFFTNLKTHFIENTEWAVGTIIIPFLTFLWGLWRGKNKKEVSA